MQPCYANYHIRLHDSGVFWLVTCANSEHTCEKVPESLMHLAWYNRFLPEAVKADCEIRHLADSRVKSSRMMEILHRKFVESEKFALTWTKVDVKNYIASLRRQVSTNQMHHLHNRLTAEGGWVEFRQHNSGVVDLVILSNLAQQQQIHRYGDAVYFDATYKVNKFQFPVCFFTGLNHEAV